MEASIQKWGNSNAIRLPKPILKTANIEEYDTVEIIAGDNEIVIRKAERRKHITLKKRLQGWDGVYKPDAIDWGEPVGREVW
jgi:antitoxin MazE